MPRAALSGSSCEQRSAVNGREQRSADLSHIHTSHHITSHMPRAALSGLGCEQRSAVNGCEQRSAVNCREQRSADFLHTYRHTCVIHTLLYKHTSNTCFHTYKHTYNWSQIPRHLGDQSSSTYTTNQYKNNNEHNVRMSRSAWHEQ